MEFTASQIAGFINGKIIGDQNAVITGVSPIESGEPGHLSFVSQERFAQYLEESKCSVLIVSEDLVQNKVSSATLITVENAYLSFQILMNLYQQMQSKSKNRRWIANLPSSLYWEKCKNREKLHHLFWRSHL